MTDHRGRPSLPRFLKETGGSDGGCQNTASPVSHKETCRGRQDEERRTGDVHRWNSAPTDSPRWDLAQLQRSHLYLRSLTGIVIFVSERERERCSTCPHLLGLLTWLMKQLAQWFTPVHRVTKKSPGRPEYWFPTLPQHRNPPSPPRPLPLYDHEDETEHTAELPINQLICILSGVTLHLITRCSRLYRRASLLYAKRWRATAPQTVPYLRG